MGIDDKIKRTTQEKLRLPLLAKEVGPWHFAVDVGTRITDNATGII